MWTTAELEWIENNKELIEKGLSPELIITLANLNRIGVGIRANFKTKILLFVIAETEAWDKLRLGISIVNNEEMTCTIKFNYPDIKYVYLYRHSLRKSFFKNEKVDFYEQGPWVEGKFKEHIKRYLEGLLDTEVDILFRKVERYEVLD